MCATQGFSSSTIVCSGILWIWVNMLLAALYVQIWCQVCSILRRSTKTDQQPNFWYAVLPGCTHWLIWFLNQNSNLLPAMFWFCLRVRPLCCFVQSIQQRRRRRAPNPGNCTEALTYMQWFMPQKIIVSIFIGFYCKLCEACYDTLIILVKL